MTLKDLLGKNNKSNNVHELLVDGTSVSDPKSSADAFNDYFISTGSRLAAEYVDESWSNVDNQPINYNINQSSDTFLKLSPISFDSVASTLRGLKACKATGLDKISAKIICKHNCTLVDIHLQSVTCNRHIYRLMEACSCYTNI